VQVDTYLGAARKLDRYLANAFAEVADRHQRQTDIKETCTLFATWTREDEGAIKALIARYGTAISDEPDRLRAALFYGTRTGGLGLLRDLSDLSALASRLKSTWTTLNQTAQALQDTEFRDMCLAAISRHDRQLQWLETRIKQLAPQTLVVASPRPTSELRASLPKQPSPVTTPTFAWAAVAASFAIFVVAIAAVAAGQPWLIPSLGPTAYLMAENPAHPTSRFYNAVVGHAIGIGAAFAALEIFGTKNDPSVLVTHELTGARAWTAVVAIAISVLIAVLARASHPPAAATTLLFALGGLTATRNAVIATMIGVLIVSGVGVAFRHIRLRGARTHLLVPAKLTAASAGRDEVVQPASD
jgi:hypothetical protein